MSEKEDTNSKTETVEEAAIRLQAECYSPYQIISNSPKEYNFYKGFMAAINWQKEHCYTEQEVIAICEALKDFILDLDVLRETVNTNKIEEMDVRQFLKTPPVK